MGCKEVLPRNYLCIFYSFECKLCGMVELCIVKNPVFFCFTILTVFDGKKIVSKIEISRYGETNNFKKSTTR